MIRPEVVESVKKHIQLLENEVTRGQLNFIIENDTEQNLVIDLAHEIEGVVTSKNFEEIIEKALGHYKYDEIEKRKKAEKVLKLRDQEDRQFVEDHLQSLSKRLRLERTIIRASLRFLILAAGVAILLYPYAGLNTYQVILKVLLGLIPIVFTIYPNWLKLKISTKTANTRLKKYIIKQNLSAKFQKFSAIWNGKDYVINKENQ